MSIPPIISFVSDEVVSYPSDTSVVISSLDQNNGFELMYLEFSVTNVSSVDVTLTYIDERNEETVSGCDRILSTGNSFLCRHSDVIPQFYSQIYESVSRYSLLLMSAL